MFRLADKRIIGGAFVAKMFRLADKRIVGGAFVAKMFRLADKRTDHSFKERSFLPNMDAAPPNVIVERELSGRVPERLKVEA